METPGYKQDIIDFTHHLGKSLDLNITWKTSHSIAAKLKPTEMVTDHYVVGCKLHQANHRA